MDQKENPNPTFAIPTKSSVLASESTNRSNSRKNNGSAAKAANPRRRRNEQISQQDPSEATVESSTVPQQRTTTQPQQATAFFRAKPSLRSKHHNAKKASALSSSTQNDISSVSNSSQPPANNRFTEHISHESASNSIHSEDTDTKTTKLKTSKARKSKEKQPENMSNVASTSDADVPLPTHQRHDQKPQVPPVIYEPYFSPPEVEKQIAAGTLLRGVLRVNPKNNTDAYVSLDTTPNENFLRLYPQLESFDVGSDNDIYICGEGCRNRAISGDVVAVSILNDSAADKVHKQNRSVDDKRIDRIKENRRKRLEKMATKIHESTNNNRSQISPAGSNFNGSIEPTTKPSKRIYGTVAAVLSHNNDRSFTGNLLNNPPAIATKRYPIFISSLEKPVLWFKPLDTALPFMVVPLNSVPKASQNEDSKQLCKVRMGRWGTRDPYPTATFIKYLGQRGSIGIETSLILEENGVCTEPFASDVLDCLPETPWRIPNKELKDRTDLREKCIFTIDPSSARDLDDAVSCSRLPNGNILVGVHIADVSFFVRPQTALDRQARQRATTTYMVQKAYPMLPSILCEDLCSLNPGVDRLAFSVMWEMEAKTATVLSTWFGRTIINSACKLSYDDAQNVIDGNHIASYLPCYETFKGKVKPASSKRKAQIESSIMWFYRLSKIMRKRRFGSGALSLNSVKLSFELDGSGEPIDCWPYVIKDSNRLIEEFMLLANMSVAARIEATFPDASLLRRHSPPLQNRLDEVCKQLELSGVRILNGSASDIQESLNNIKDPNTRFTVEEMLTGPMQRAVYFSTHAIGDKAGYRHFALNVPLYTHFTSPIRRYADIIVHRTLEASLAMSGNHVSTDHPLLPQYYSPFFPKTPADGSLTTSIKSAKSMLIPKPKEIAEIAHQCNLRKDAAKKAQDASSKLFLAHYLTSMASKLSTPGIISLGVVTKTNQEKFTITVPAFGIDGTIYMDRLADRRNQIVSIDSRQWGLRLWTVESATVTLIWEANSADNKPELELNSSNAVSALSDALSALVIDNHGHGTVQFGHATKSECYTQKLKIFDKVTVCMLPVNTPPDISIKLVMPSIYK
ncbi:hypothetical protein GGI25_003957 [Coemansia spiralis]|uniref:DIS3-like exonuclease 2 n=2 Tax=Coemansia TaxID=4863 RepID=A0A9W8G157_9FUNG|nr:hypothetical protein GGI26_004575 [Coemansia sp. RSA 1358]KAJ2675450.1 hypothetical protein GGI25_003957 [Coemansia spiralis]